MKTVVAIFAHPDDEALGPGGTIATLSKTHTVYVICVTNGDADGVDEKKRKKIGTIRRKELLTSAKILGVTKVYFLGYKDGSLSNSLYHEIAVNIEKKLKILKPEILMTFEHRGVSGHLDHIAVSMMTTFVFRRTQIARELWYYATRAVHRNAMKNYFIYFPPGYDRDAVDKVIDVSSVWDTKVKAMRAHHSQTKDVERILGSIEKLPKEELFFVMELPKDE
ncbi:MAG TPA: PIG-L deacetylase family protein [Patescibacteria group bacterium]|nr:PIG-L deacetylase family protein [Patescibacteria group bacterium]